ncbi:MAG TPA: hypothetical protein VF228_14900 [Iamia sp.]
MRTETEMHELVVAKVAAHRRRRALLASAGGGVAVVLLLVAVAAAAASSGPDEDVMTNPGDPTTTEASSTTTEAEEPSTTTTTTEPAPETTTTTEPPPTTTEAPTTTTEPPPTTTTTPPDGPTPTVVTGVDGDMNVTFTITTDPARPGVVVVRIQVTDPTGVDVHPDASHKRGPGGIIYVGDVVEYYGDVPASCGHGDLDGTEPADYDEVVELELPSGPQRLDIQAFTLACHAEVNEVAIERDVVVP